MVVQLVGRTPEHIASGARLAVAAGAQIININMTRRAKSRRSPNQQTPGALVMIQWIA
jgi:uncharacterized protein (DUF849 family)